MTMPVTPASTKGPPISGNTNMATSGTPILTSIAAKIPCTPWFIAWEIAVMARARMPQARQIPQATTAAKMPYAPLVQ